jgi:hypothetical protein
LFHLDFAHGGLNIVHAFDIDTDGAGLIGLLFSDGKLWGPTTGAGQAAGETVWSLSPKGILKRIP